MHNVKRVVWVFGPSASGKSTLLTVVSEVFKKRKKRILVLRDLEQLIELMRDDTTQQHHEKRPNGDFRITSSTLYDQSIIQLCQIIKKSYHLYDLIIVEVTCGLSKDRRVDLSIARRLRFISGDIAQLSTYLYIKNTLPRRTSFNRSRTGLLRVPDDVFTLYYKTDDFDQVARKTPLMFHILNNSGSLDDFTHSVQQWFLQVGDHTL